MFLISFYSGTPGSGKSLHVAQVIERYIRKGKNVLANFEIADAIIKPKRKVPKGNFVYVSNGDLMRKYGRSNNIDVFACLYGYALNFHAKNPRGQIMEDQTLIVIDEAQILFNSRSWQDSSRLQWVEFFTQHRKYGFTIIIVSQMERLIDRQIRGCFEYELNHKKINNYKAFGKLLGLLCGGTLFICVTHWYGIKGKDSKVDAQYFVGKNRYYDLYNSYKIFGSQE